MSRDPPKSGRLRRLRRRTAGFAADESGGVAVFVGLCLVALLGFTALGIDVALWYQTRTACQNAADSAAFSGATALYAGASDPGPAARAVTAGYGFVDGELGVAVTVNSPPASGGHLSEGGSVEVIVRTPAARLFTRVFGLGPGMITARAVAQAGVTGNGCVVALHTDASVSALETGAADVRLTGCSLYGNSSGSAALTLKGAASISADSIRLVGGYSISGAARMSTADGVWTGQPPVEDPYAGVPVPSYGGCDYAAVSLPSGRYGGGGSPTVFCGGLSVNGGASVVFEPGVYVIDRGAFTINGGAQVSGSGVTFVLTSSTGSNYPSVAINGGAVVTLSAPTTGPTQGLVFYQDRRASASGSNTFNGGAQLNLTGAIYFPNQLVTFTGGSSTAASGCTELVAGSVHFQGTSTFGAHCEGLGVRLAGGRRTRLVE